MWDLDGVNKRLLNRLFNGSTKGRLDVEAPSGLLLSCKIAVNQVAYTDNSSLLNTHEQIVKPFLEIEVD